MANPFENPDGAFVVLVNDEGQRSLWPAEIAVPAGWVREYGPAAREICLDRIERLWTDMRPRSLVAG